MAQAPDPKGKPSDRGPSPEQISNALDKLEGRMAALRGAFEQFFLGLERHPPVHERDRLKKDIEATRVSISRNTALKFRASGLFNKFLTYEHLWARTLTDIEEGRYSRDLFKARLHRSRRASTPPSSSAGPSEEVDLSDFSEDTPRQRSATASSPEAPGALSEQRLRSIYETYVAAKAEYGEPTRLTFEQLAQRLRKQVPEVLAKTGASSVDFKVLIKNGKPILHAVTKRSPSSND
jgi:hypothetical protein